MKTFFAGIYVAVCWSFSSAALASADVYGKLPGLNTIDLSPKGTRYALVTEIQGQPRLVILNEQDKPIFVNPLPDAKIRGLQ